ncbi:MAG: hypothetical protein KKG64_01780, partial [Firmicutes bacterium]|nr:hypothetical protein [Bacillota bacterium]
MRKVFIILVIILVLSLSSCIELTEDNLKIQLNPGVDTIEVDDQFIDAGANASFGFRTLHPVV